MFNLGSSGLPRTRHHAGSRTLSFLDTFSLAIKARQPQTFKRSNKVFDVAVSSTSALLAPHPRLGPWAGRTTAD
jgi:hypothetical protein